MDSGSIHRRRGEPRQRRSRVLRRVGIGTRLGVVLALPATALIAMILLLSMSDIETTRGVRDFRASGARTAQLVDIRTIIQVERHRTVARAEGAAFAMSPQLAAAFAPSTTDAYPIPVPIIERANLALALARSADRTGGIREWTAAIESIDELLLDELADPPPGEIDRRSDALLALLAAHEAMLREDIAIQLGQVDPIEITELHAAEVAGLHGFARDASPAGLRELEALTVTPEWGDVADLRAELVDPRTETFDAAEWGRANERRIDGTQSLVEASAVELQRAAADVANRGIERLALIGGLSLGVVLASVALFVAIRRSIVAPLRSIGHGARRLARGTEASITDVASDEIGAVADSIRNLQNTLHRIWEDIDLVSTSMANGERDQRIRVDGLRGDWLHLAETLNTTLATAEAHHFSTEAELIRREILAEVSSAALNAENAAELTNVVLRNLPLALPGSVARLHEHPSGPPHLRLGVELEPTISALEIPIISDHAQNVDLRNGRSGIASLVEFEEGPPAVLVLDFGRLRPEDPGPIVGLVETASRLLAQAHRRQAAEWSATHLLEHDALTGLHSSVGLQRWFDEHRDRSDRWTIIGLQPLRLDALDSTSGRDARNTMLTIISRRLRRLVAPRQVAGRIGEPEFVMLVPRQETDRAIETILESFSHPISVGADVISVDLSIGVAEITDDIEQGFANASTAGRQIRGHSTTVVHFDEQHREMAVRRNDTLRWLEQALDGTGGDDSHLEVHYQPVVDAITTNVVGYEALIRGRRNGLLIPPGEFIPLAEESGHIIRLGEFTLRDACASMDLLPGESPYVAVNLSPLEFNDPDLLTRIGAVLEETGAERSRLVFEVTEGAATTDEHIELLHRLREFGVKIAIDDFGTGHANLSYLTTFPAEIVKLDRCLVTPMVDDRLSRKVVEGAIRMAHEIGMTVIAEGVETNDELNVLRRFRCDRIQGWYTGKPEPLAKLIEVATHPRTTITEPVAKR